MKLVTFYYNKTTLQIDAVFVNCETPSSSWNNATYIKETIINPKFEITRNHKVVLTAGKVTGTSPSTNPVQPPEPTDWKDEWSKASTDADKFNVISGILNLK